MKVSNDTNLSCVCEHQHSSFRILNKLTLENRIQGIANESIHDSFGRVCEGHCPTNDCGYPDGD